MNYVTSQYPPVFLMTAAGDFLREQAPLLVEKLMEFEIPFVYRYYGSADRASGSTCSTATSACRRLRGATMRNAIFSKLLLIHSGQLIQNSENFGDSYML